MDPGTNLDRHWYTHSPECNEKWRAYLQCYDNHPWLRTIFNACGNQYAAVATCFKEERLAKRQKNHESSEKRKAELVKGLVEAELNEEFNLQKSWMAKGK